ncbi:hypothetical protein NWF32_30155 [Pseudomonas qingdaonensis]|nr:hypothetical protein [Pseudomonas qingdaonensis]
MIVNDDKHQPIKHGHIRNQDLKGQTAFAYKYRSLGLPHLGRFGLFHFVVAWGADAPAELVQVGHTRQIGEGFVDIKERCQPMEISLNEQLAGFRASFRRP